MSYDPKQYRKALNLLARGATVKHELQDEEREQVLLAVNNLTTGSGELARLLEQHNPLDIPNLYPVGPRQLPRDGGAAD